MCVCGGERERGHWVDVRGKDDLFSCDICVKTFKKEVSLKASRALLRFFVCD